MDKIEDVIFEKYQVRKSNKQKADFRAFVKLIMGDKYEVKEDIIGKNVNVVLGDIDRAKIIIGAHYDTCAVLPIPNFNIPNNLAGFIVSQVIIVLVLFEMAHVIANLIMMIGGKLNFIFNVCLLFLVWWTMYGASNRHTVNDNTSGVITVLKIAQKLDIQLRDKVCFVLFDNEEKGLLGSKAMNKKYDVKDKLVLNFDCVSDGDDLVFFPNKALKKNEEMEAIINKVYKCSANKRVSVNKGFGLYASDNLMFNKAYGICALKKCLGINYMDRIHTVFDTKYDEENINILVNGTCAFVEKYLIIE